MSEDVPPSDKNAVPATTLDQASPVVAPSPSHVSSASASASASASSNTGTLPPTMMTIDSPIRKNSDDVMNVPPVHPFFNQQQFAYDSDGSDGR
jgi:hypothetical protein